MDRFLGAVRRWQDVSERVHAFHLFEATARGSYEIFIMALSSLWCAEQVEQVFGLVFFRLLNIVWRYCFFQELQLWGYATVQ